MAKRVFDLEKNTSEIYKENSLKDSFQQNFSKIQSSDKHDL